MTGNFFLNFIQLGINLTNGIYNLFAPADLLSNLSALFTLAEQRIPQLLTFLSYVSFFIPLSYLIVPITCAVSFFTMRLVFALFHFITNLWGDLKLF